MYFSSTPKTYEPEESEFENAYELKIHDNTLPKVTQSLLLIFSKIAFFTSIVTK